MKMTAMPQMVAIFNGCGGGAAALVAMGDDVFVCCATRAATVPVDQAIPIVLSAPSARSASRAASSRS